jgi:ubiquinone/menaquinone biosynthesis C-methylase UbiE
MTGFDPTLYRAPQSLAPLRLEGSRLVSEDGEQFEIDNGVPDLTWPKSLSAGEERTKSAYDHIAAQIYNAAMEWQFAALYQDEEHVRELMVEMIDPKPGHRILEVGCGTGHDSYRIARRLGPAGSLFLQDLSPGMLHICRLNMAEHGGASGFKCALNYSISNAVHLPFADNFFDSVFHFGGFNEFSDKKRSAEEFARVVKPGGRVLFGDESVGPWLRGTDFGKIVTTNNQLFANPLPLDAIPVSARDVNIRWIMANCFYVITFLKGDGAPPLNLDLAHKGWRGGTMRSRYYGVLEGVTPEAKDMVRKAAARQGVSIHDWLDRLVRRQATEDLGVAPDPPK